MAAGARGGRFSAAWPRLWPVIALAALGGAAAMVRRGRHTAPGPAVARCPIHGISYDTELEACPECAKAPAAAGGRA